MLAVALAAILYVYKYQSDLPQHWKRVKPSKEISVSLPPDAKEIKAEKGKESLPDLNLWVYVDSGVGYTVSTFPVPVDEEKQPLDALVAEIVIDCCKTMRQSRITLQRDVLYHGWPGLEALIVDGEGSATWTRAYAIDKTCVLLCENYDSSKGMPLGLSAFMNSLVFSPAPKAGVQQKPGPVFTKFHPKDGRFDVGMPEQPASEETPEGDSTIHQFQATYGNRIYIAAYFDPPNSGPPQKMRGAMVDDMLGVLEAKPEKKTTFTRDGHEFDTIQFTPTDGFSGRLDVTVDGNRCFAILMLYPVGHAGAPDIEAFFKSFKLVGKQ